VGSSAELATIGAVVPFIAILISPERFLENSFAAPYLASLGIQRADQLLLPISITFGLLAILSAAMRMLQLHASLRFSFGLGTELSTAIFRRSLYQPYLVHVRRNSSQLVHTIVRSTGMLMTYVVLSGVLLCSAVMMMLFVVVGLLVVAPSTTLIVFSGLGSIYLAIMLYTRSRIHRSSIERERGSVFVLKLVEETFAGIRDVLLGHNQEVYSEAYRRADDRLRRAESYSMMIGSAPRFLIEGVAMCFVAVVAYHLAAPEGGITSALPILGAVALGAQRLLPVMQQVYNSIILIRSNQAALAECVLLLDQKVPADALNPDPPKLRFERDIVLAGLSFRYHDDRPAILDDISLKVLKGQKVGVIGATGSGKSTLTDILMGLLKPTSGKLLVDGTLIGDSTTRAWQACLSHVPQSIFLIDASVAENIALTEPGKPIDMERVKACAAMANISTHIERMPHGYDSHVGERGVRLSGGQRQRIGIARALYKQADVIFLDEATSALDSETESDIMRSINQLNLTFFIVAHRVTTLSQCDLVIELKDGRIVRTGTYAEMIEGAQ
jgi:ATP-binding cassette subfamily B protein